MSYLTRLALLCACFSCLSALGTPQATAQTDSLVLVAPKGGEIFYTNRDTLVDVRWTGVDDTTKIKLEWSVDGQVWNVIADSATMLSYQWNVKGLPLSTTYRVRARQIRAPYASDNIRYTGHTDVVNDGAWDPSGTRVVTVSQQPHIWDAEVGGSTPLVALPSNAVSHSSVAWSADSTRIAAGADDNTARTFDARTNQLELGLPHPASVMDVALNPAGDRVFTAASDDRLRWFQLPQTTAAGTFIPTSTLLEMALSNNGDRVLACTDRSARVFSTAGGLPVIFSLHQSGTLGGSWSPNDSLICTIGGDRTVRLWNSATGTEIWNATDNLEGVRCVAYSPDGTQIAVGMSDSTVTIWDAATGTQTASLGGHRAKVAVVAWAPQGDLVASGSDDNTIRVHDVATKRLVGVYQHTGDILSLQWSPEGARLLSTSADRTAVIWRAREITLQGDTSAVFSISDPPPAYTRFTATGDTLDIGDQTTITVGMEASYNLDLADIDSVQFTLRYDWTMLHRQSSSVAVASEIDSGYYRLVTFAPIALPTTDQNLMTVTFRATLGADSVSSLHFSGIRQIGSGIPIPVGTRSDSIVVRGICREGGTGRLFRPAGSVLQITQLPDGSGIDVSLIENGPTSIAAYDLLGNLIWSDVATTEELQQLHLQRSLSRTARASCVLFVVSTPTQSMSVMITGATR